MSTVFSLHRRNFYCFREPYSLRAPGYFEINWRRWSLATELIYCGTDEDKWPWMIHLHVLLLNLFIHFPGPLLKISDPANFSEWSSWGFSFADFGPHLHWGEHTKCLDWPWQPVQVRHEVERPDGSWVPFVGSWERDKQPDGKLIQTFPYRYVLKNGTIQNRIAEVYVGRRARRPKWLRWTSLFEKVRYEIDVAFSEEVGERTGSWKGGTIGCGYTMNPGETAEQCLRRMERERIFD